MTDTTARRWAIYVRISQDREGAGLGVDRQETDCRALAAQLGGTVVAVYIDNDVSAYSGKRRKGYEKLLAAIESGAINGVLAWHPDRLHRSPLELESYIDLSDPAPKSRRQGVITHTVRAGRWDLSTPSGRMVARMIGAAARYESEHKSDRIRAARVQAAKAGKHHGGMRPFGFERDGVTLRPYEAAEIRTAAEAVVSGVSLRALVRDLNARGVLTVKAANLVEQGEELPPGKYMWSSQAVRDFLVSPRSAGLSSHLGEVVGTAQWPAIVPESTWRAARAILTDPARRTNGGRGRGPAWLGSGIYVCGVCGKAALRVSSKSSSGKTNSLKKVIRPYRCSNREFYAETGHVNRDAYLLDAFVEEVVVGYMAQNRNLLQRLTKRQHGEGVDVDAMVAEQAAIREQQDEAALMFTRREITGRQLATMTADLETRADELTAQLAAIGERGPLDEVAAADDVRTLWFGTKEDRSDGLPLAKRRAILQALVTVTVLKTVKRGPAFDPEGVRFDWKTGTAA
ncbi:recombinase family protein [Nocardia sp. MH4]|uniref:recombinase family protein n=1 Tax=Nocardia sp. MH4 TaxID=1768677 RepID=UPI001C4E5F61|nr:recombinase family protein [Nocardia sp. MH4]